MYLLINPLKMYQELVQKTCFYCCNLQLQGEGINDRDCTYVTDIQTVKIYNLHDGSRSRSKRSERTNPRRRCGNCTPMHGEIRLWVMTHFRFRWDYPLCGNSIIQYIQDPVRHSDDPFPTVGAKFIIGFCCSFLTEIYLAGCRRTVEGI